MVGFLPVWEGGAACVARKDSGIRNAGRGMPRPYNVYRLRELDESASPPNLDKGWTISYYGHDGRASPRSRVIRTAEFRAGSDSGRFAILQGRLPAQAGRHQIGRASCRERV